MRARRFGGERRRWWTLAAVAFGLFMVMLDNTVVNVALPSIERDLGISISQLEWVVNAYALTFAVLLLTGGKLADMFGRRRLFSIGMALFGVSSLLCGISGSAALLIGARALQGAGSALMMPATLSIISATFPAEERGTAIGIWAGVSASALAIGPLVGGLITENLGWNWIFYVNVPIGCVGLVAAALLIDESRDPALERRLDVPGLLAAGASVFALTYALIEGNRHGWNSPLILSLFGLSAVALAVFIALERRQRLPMLDLRLFRDRTFLGANLTALLISLAMFGVFFYVSIYMQIVRGYTAVEAGATFLPMTVMVIFVAPLAGRIADRIGSRAPMTVGMTLMATMMWWFSRVDLRTGFFEMLPGLLIGGVGMGLTMTPMTAAVLAAVPVDRSGVGSGVLSTFRQLGGALGIAVMGAVVAATVHVTPAQPGFRTEFLQGFQRAQRVSAVLALLGAAVAALLIRRRTEEPSVPSLPAPRSGSRHNHRYRALRTRPGSAPPTVARTRVPRR